MTTFGIAMVRDEADIIAQTINHMRAQVDALIVADNQSVDGTREWLEEEVDDTFTLVDDPEPGYLQSEKMSGLAARAAEGGAGWVVPFDADEIWFSPHGRIADVLAGCESAVATAEVFNHYATAVDEQGSPLERMVWRDAEPLGLPKVACRPVLRATIAQGNHAAHYPGGVASGLLQIRHFPYRSPEQFVRKARNGAAAYAATDLPFEIGQHWREYGELIEREGPQAGEAWFREHFWISDPKAHGLVRDPCPSLS